MSALGRHQLQDIATSTHLPGCVFGKCAVQIAEQEQHHDAPPEDVFCRLA